MIQYTFLERRISVSPEKYYKNLKTHQITEHFEKSQKKWKKKRSLFTTIDNPNTTTLMHMSTQFRARLGIEARKEIEILVLLVSETLTVIAIIAKIMLIKSSFSVKTPIVRTMNPQITSSTQIHQLIIATPPPIAIPT